VDVIEIVGRSSSHFTRMARIFAEELGVAYRLVPVLDMKVLSADAYGDNPAMKLPAMRMEGSTHFGAQNICRALAYRSTRKKRIIWPEELRDPLSCNAQEFVWHGMAAQVQIAFGVLICKLPEDNLYFTKAHKGFEGALGWLDEHLAEVIGRLPSGRDLSLFEVSLFCLVDHLSFRRTVSLAPYKHLISFKDEFAKRPSAGSTAYRFDS
jgi:glutathione S-transferase